MKIELKQIKVSEVFKGYLDLENDGVVGYGGRLNIRPKYQREFVYKDKERNAVINSVFNGFPLNVMYWSKIGEDEYELLDGQQRTISICQYLDNVFSMKNLFNKSDVYFSGLSSLEKNKIEDYELMVYICEGTEDEVLEWFKVINIAGVELSPQELRNAVYTGSWLTDAKKYFSKNDCAAYKIAKDYLNGNCNRQDYLETVIKWKANYDKLNGNDIISSYMSLHRNDLNASDLWNYFNKVISWVKKIFPTYSKVMKGIEWGYLYNKYHMNHYDPAQLEKEISELLADEEVTSDKGVYEYVLQINKEEKLLSIRTFDKKIKTKVYNKQGGLCVICNNPFEIKDMDADHILPWSKGGKTVIENCQLLCRKCNLEKSNK